MKNRRQVWPKCRLSPAAGCYFEPWQPFSPTLKRCLGCLAWVRNGGHIHFPCTIPPGAWHRYTPPCLCAPWHPSHGLICHSLTIASSTGLAHGRQLLSPGQHLSPLPFSHLNGVLSIVRDIKGKSINYIEKVSWKGQKSLGLLSLLLQSSGCIMHVII